MMVKTTAGNKNGGPKAAVSFKQLSRSLGLSGEHPVRELRPERSRGPENLHDVAGSLSRNPGRAGAVDLQNTRSIRISAI